MATRDERIAGMVPAVRRIARRVAGRTGHDAGDLEGAGYEALCEVADANPDATPDGYRAIAAVAAERRMVDAVRAASAVRNGGPGRRGTGRRVTAVDLRPDDADPARPPPADPRAADPADLAAARELVLAPPTAPALPPPAEVAERVTRLRAAMFAAVSEADVGAVMAGVVARAKDGSHRDVRIVLDLLAPGRSGVTVQQNVQTVVVRPDDLA